MSTHSSGIFIALSRSKFRRQAAWTMSKSIFSLLCRPCWSITVYVMASGTPRGYERRPVAWQRSKRSTKPEQIAAKTCKKDQKRADFISAALFRSLLGLNGKHPEALQHRHVGMEGHGDHLSAKHLSIPDPSELLGLIMTYRHRRSSKKQLPSR